MIHRKTKLSEVLEIGKECKRCGECCTKGSGALIREDLKKIADFLDITVDELKDKHLEKIEKFNTTLFRPKLAREKGRPYGKCIFFSERHGCAIQEVKPAECRVGNCNKDGEELSLWFTLNYFVNENDPESIRQYATYIRAGGKVLAGGKLEDLVPDREKLKKILEYKIIR